MYSNHVLATTGKSCSKKKVAFAQIIKGENVFKCYYGRPEATTKEFTDDGWFKTGDTAQFSEQSYKILGRSSVDIIK